MTKTTLDKQKWSLNSLNICQIHTDGEKKKQCNKRKKKKKQFCFKAADN